MDKSLIVFMLVGIGFFYVVMNIVKETETPEDRAFTSSYQQEQYNQYYKVDNIGQDIIDVVGAPAGVQIKAWNNSPLKEELLEIFPDFDTMKGFVKNRVKGDVLQQKLLSRISEVEDKFFSGTIDAEQAKRMLGKL